MAAKNILDERSTKLVHRYDCGKKFESIKVSKLSANIPKGILKRKRKADSTKSSVHSHEIRKCDAMVTLEKFTKYIRHKNQNSDEKIIIHLEQFNDFCEKTGKRSICNHSLENSSPNTSKKRKPNPEKISREDKPEKKSVETNENLSSTSAFGNRIPDNDSTNMVSSESVKTTSSGSELSDDTLKRTNSGKTKFVSLGRLCQMEEEVKVWNTFFGTSYSLKSKFL